MLGSEAEPPRFSPSIPRLPPIPRPVGIWVCSSLDAQALCIPKIPGRRSSPLDGAKSSARSPNRPTRSNGCAGAYPTYRPGRSFGRLAVAKTDRKYVWRSLLLRDAPDVQGQTLLAIAEDRVVDALDLDQDGLRELVGEHEFCAGWQDELAHGYSSRRRSRAE